MFTLHIFIDVDLADQSSAFVTESGGVDYRALSDKVHETADRIKEGNDFGTIFTHSRGYVESVGSWGIDQ